MLYAWLSIPIYTLKSKIQPKNEYTIYAIIWAKFYKRYPEDADAVLR